MTQTPRPPSTPPSSSRRTGFRLNRIGVVGIAVFLVIIVSAWLLGGHGEIGGVYGLGYLTGVIVTGFLLAIIVAGIVYLIARRSRTALNLTFAIVLLLVGFGRMGNVFTMASDRQVIEQLFREPDEHAAGQTAKVEEPLIGEEAERNLQETIDRFNRDADQTSGRESQITSALSDNLSLLQEPKKQYNLALRRFTDAGSTVPSTLTTHEAIEHRRALLDDFATANEHLAEVYTSLEGDLRQRLESLGLAPERVEYLVGRWKGGAQPELIAAIRQTDRDLVTHFRGIINTLDDALGRWEVNSQGQLIFDDTAAANQYNTHFHGMKDAAAEQRRLQDELNEILDKREN